MSTRHDHSHNPGHSHGLSRLQAVLDELCMSQRALARGAGMSLAAVNRLLKSGELPRRSTEAARVRVVEFLRAQGAAPHQLGSLLLPGRLPQKKTPARSELTGATLEQAESKQPKEEHMLLQNANLTEAAKKHFGLPRSPFIDDVQSREDVFHTPGIRYARAALMDAAKNSGFIALVGESGSGKSTLVEELEERVREHDADVVVIKPYVLAMEGDDRKGKTLKAEHIAEAIVAELDPHAKLRRSPQARFAQLHELLKASRRAGRRHLLVIEEAHCLPHATLKHLKRFTELKDGLQRLMGVALIGQTELRRTLESQNAEIREVAQRCEVLELPPLDAELQDYLRHKFARFDLKYEDVFDKDAADAIRARLIQTDRNSKQTISLCYPLAVHNLVCRAMNVSAELGWPKVDAQAVAGC